MSEHNSPTVHLSKALSEIYLRKGEIFTVNVENPEKDTSPHYFHIEVWSTPEGKPMVFLPSNVEVKNYDDWNNEYKKHFK